MCSWMGWGFFFKAEDSSYPQASLYPSVKLKWYQKLWKKSTFKACVTEYYTTGPGAKEDHATWGIQSCPAEEQVMLIDRFKSNKRTFSSFWFWWGMFWCRCFKLSKCKLIPVKLKRRKLGKEKFASGQRWISAFEYFSSGTKENHANGHI